MEFPPLPSSVSSYKGASDGYIDANIQLAIQVGRRLSGASAARRNVHIVVPDRPELDRARKLFGAALELAGGAVTLGSLTPDSFASTFAAIFSGRAEDDREASPLTFGGGGVVGL